MRGGGNYVVTWQQRSVNDNTSSDNISNFNPHKENYLTIEMGTLYQRIAESKSLTYFRILSAYLWDVVVHHFVT